MKKNILAILLSFIAIGLSAQDAAVIDIIAPTSGCALTNSETVTIKIFNYGPDIVTPFNVQYTIDGGPPVTDVVGTTIFQNSTLIFTFSTPADLSVTGPHTIVAYTQLPGDVNPTNDAFTVNIQNDAPSVGGTVAPAAATVCSGANGGTLTLSGETGAVQNWEYSTDGGNTWVNIVNTGTTQNYSNITITTRYRAVVKSGICASANSATSIITVNAPSVGGTVASSATVCSGSNSGTLTLGGQTGAVVRWQFSTDGGFTWNNIANVTTSQNYLNLVVNTMYRAQVQSGVCAIANSNPATITVTPVSVGGTVSSNATVCSGSNSGTLTLAGQTGNVIRWEYSTDGGNNWIPVANTTTSLTYNNITMTTMYRAVVQSGVCSSANSTSVTITVTPVSVGGTVTASATVCSGSNSGTLTLSGQTGAVLRWQFSTDGGFTWNNIANVTTSQNYLNLVITTMYRAVVQSGGCASANSNPATITVDPVSVGGTVSSSATVCSGTNNGTLTLAGQTGSVIRWEYSTDGGNNWVPIANTTTSLTYNNITMTTMYRAVVQSGVCASANSSAVTITTDPVSVGGTVTASTNVCSGANNGTLTLSGQTGNVLNWEFSTDGGFTWNPIVNNTTTQNYLNLVITTMYRAVVQSGTCASANSNPATITVDPVSVGGTVTANATVCSGNNSGTLTLSGQTGNVTGWEFSTDGGNNWIPISNTTSSQNYTNLTMTTMYRAVVQSGTCPSANSAPATITVDPVSVGGTIASNATVCSGSNNGTLTLSGNVGSVLNWEFSTDGGFTWNNIVNTTNTETYTNLIITTWYRAIVQSGTCPNDTSSIVVITVDPASVGGTVTANATVCSGNNNGTLTLSGQTGNVLNWEYSTDGGFTWILIANTTTSLTYNNLAMTTMYQAVVQNGVCSAVNSTPATITVDPVSVGGTISSNATVCEGNNSGTLTLNGYTGSILDWQMSTDNGATWAALGNTTNTQTYTNLTDTTWYWAIVQSGTCPADTSAIAIITVNPKPVAGFTATTVCEGDTTVFTNTTTLAGGSIQYYWWDFGDNTTSVSNNPMHVYADSGNYNVTLIAYTTAGCSDTVTNVVRVNPHPSAQITASGPIKFCLGDSVTLSVPSGANLTYLWNTGSNNDSITVDSTGTYIVTVADTTTGCSSIDSVHVTVFPLPTVDAGMDTTISLGTTVTLHGSGNGSFSWLPTTVSDPFIANPTATPVATTVYTLTVTDNNGCMNADSVKITVNADYNITISNLLTPNGDGFNDTWYIQNIDFYLENKVMIFNRNGQKVFEMEDYHNSWDGTPLPDGTYYYVLTFENSDKVFKGAVTIMRSEK